MANTSQVQFSYHVVDELGVSTAATLYALADPTNQIGDLVAQWRAFELLLQAIIGGSVQRGKVSLIATPAAVASPGAGSRVEQQGIFNYLLTGGTKHWGDAAPSLLNSKIVNGKINLADAAVAAYTAAIAASPAWTGASAGTATGVYASNQFVQLGALVDAFLAFRKRRQQLRSLTFEL